MNDPLSKLHLQQEQHSQQAEDNLAGQVAGQSVQAHEFATVEELIRSDKDQTELPIGIAERLNETIGNEPKPDKPWWQRLFGNES